MKKFLIIGGGAMGSAFTIPCLENKNDVVITEPYSKKFIKELSSKRKYHSALKMNLPKKLKFRKYSGDLLKEKFDLIVIALSLPGIDFIGKELKKNKINTPLLVLTKGLKYISSSKKIFTISEKLQKISGIKNISVLKGPCLAKELARKHQTSVIIANKSINFAKKIGKRISTKYYLNEFSKDIIGVEVCSAIKNIYAMIIGAGQSLNTSSSDLYVSAAGGRNSKMGSYLGKGYTFKNAKKRFMPNDTVEGEQLVREIAPYIMRKINKKKIPLMISLFRAILNNRKLTVT